jgi:chemotaxis protein MotA
MATHGRPLTPFPGISAVFLIIGLVVVIGSVIGGYVMHHGKLPVLWQPTEFIIIVGAGIGSMIVSNPPALLKHIMAGIMGLLKPNPFTKKAYGELLQVLFQIFNKARKDGLVGLESHIEDPTKSDIFSKYPGFMHHHHAVALLADTLKVLLTGTIEDHNLAEILDMDLDQHHHEADQVPTAVAAVGDAMPAFGIVACVLGVINTMGSIGGPPSELGEKVAAALVGTFVGILLAYGLFSPMATAIKGRNASEHAYLMCIKTALLSFARGDAPMTAVEFARRNIEPGDRPTFAELEELAKAAKAA